MLAGELAARGVDTAVLEARTEPHGGALAARALEFGATLHIGCAVEDFAQDEDRVTVRLADGAPVRTVRAAYLIGCDGAHSRIRKAYHAERHPSADPRYEPGGADTHPLAGRPAPSLGLDIAPGHGPVLLDLADDPDVRATAAGWADRVSVGRYRCPARPDLAALLVRPDGYVAWAARRHESPARRRTGLLDALRRWLGEPTGPRTALLSHR
jgi:hypothetical protein